MEKAVATHSSTLALKIPWTESLVGCTLGVSKSRTGLSDFTFHLGSVQREIEAARVVAALFGLSLSCLCLRIRIVAQIDVFLPITLCV